MYLFVYLIFTILKFFSLEINCEISSNPGTFYLNNNPNTRYFYTNMLTNFDPTMGMCLFAIFYLVF